MRTIPIAAPKLPVPSMSPETVAIAYSLSFNYYFSPKSEATVPDIRFAAPPIVKPQNHEAI